MAVTPVGVLPLHRHGPALMDGLLGGPKMQSGARVQVRTVSLGIGLALRVLGRSGWTVAAAAQAKT